jgi:hypothetical protein
MEMRSFKEALGVLCDWDAEGGSDAYAALSVSRSSTWTTILRRVEVE